MRLACASLIVLLTLTACNALPAAAPVPTPAPATQTENILVPMDYAREPTTMSLLLSGGDLRLRSTNEQLLQGSITYSANVPRPTLNAVAGSVNFVQQSDQSRQFDFANQINVIDMQINATTPLQLTLQTGAERADLDLGNLRLRQFNLAEGASTTRINFSTPNQEDMRRMGINTGASKMEILNLMNARFASMRFEGGAGDYIFDFGGKVQRAAQAQIKADKSNITIRMPATIGARVTVAEGPTPIVDGGLLPDAQGFITASWRRSQELDISILANGGTVRVETK